MLAQRFRELNRSPRFWHSSDRVLLAVSGGVDSMVLLHLFLALPQEERPQFSVAHFNHRLRPASDQEAVFLRQHCLAVGVPFYEETWQRPAGGNLEQEARRGRYAFFAKLCQQHGFDCVVTAHHGDDQAETILMKVSSGSQLQNLVGIRERSCRDGLVIYRPLLAFPKATLLAWAQAQQVPYMEDESNASDDYLRNRLRHHVIPQLKGENANFLKHIHNFVKQITYANDIIEDKVKELWPQVIHQQANQWIIELLPFRSLTESQQYMLLVSLWQEVLVVRGVTVNEAQLTRVLALLRADKGAQEIHLAAGWRFEKDYRVAYLRQGQSLVEVSESVTTIGLGEGRYLSASEWLGFEEVGRPLVKPQGTSQWHVFECPLTSEPEQPLVVRRARSGDRMQYNKAGNHKKIRRIFIDEKIPQEKRGQMWLVADSAGEILWIPPIRKSYLSIVKETDKIHYRLIYLKSGSNEGALNFLKE